MKYSDFFFSFISQTIHRETSRIPKGVVHFRAVHFFGRNRFFLLCLATERSTRVISGLGEGGMDETSFFTGKLTLLESSGRRNTRLLRFDTCASRGRFFFFQECVLGNLVKRNDERKIAEEKLTRTILFYWKIIVTFANILYEDTYIEN